MRKGRVWGPWPLDGGKDMAGRVLGQGSPSGGSGDLGAS